MGQRTDRAGVRTFNLMRNSRPRRRCHDRRRGSSTRRNSRCSSTVSSQTHRVMVVITGRIIVVSSQCLPPLPNSPNSRSMPVDTVHRWHRAVLLLPRYPARVPLMELSPRLATRVPQLARLRPSPDAISSHSPCKPTHTCTTLEQLARGHSFLFLVNDCFMYILNL